MGLWDNIKHTSIYIIGIFEGEERQQKIEKLISRNNDWKFPNLVEDIDIQAQKVQRVSKKMSPKRLTPRHFIIKMSRLKTKRESYKQQKQLLTYKGVPIILSTDLSTETLQPEGVGMKYAWNYSTQKSYYLELKDR